METADSLGDSEGLTVDSLKQEASILEEAELSFDHTLSQSGLDSEAYGRLFCIYLILGEMTSAKFLWRRMSASLKSEQHLKNLWTVASKLWTRDYKATYSAIASSSWPPSLQNYLKILERTVRQKAIHLIQKAYSVIKVEVFCELTGCSNQQSAMQLIDHLGWQFDAISNTVKPKQIQIDNSLKIQFDDELQKLTRIISAIEN